MKGTNTNMDLKINSTAFVEIKDVTIPSVFFKRMNSGIEQLDALFGNGLLPGSSITVAARAGLGKTTLMLQLLQAWRRHQLLQLVAYCLLQPLQLHLNKVDCCSLCFN